MERRAEIFGRCRAMTSASAIDRPFEQTFISLVSYGHVDRGPKIDGRERRKM